MENNSMETISCLFCKHHNAQQVITENAYHGNQCMSCNLIYISPRPRADEVIDLYGHDQAYLPAEAHIKGSFLKRLYARHTLSRIKKWIKKGALLEIGSGAGYFLDEASKAGFEPYGIELNKQQAHFITNSLHLPCQTTPLSQHSFGTQMFDVIYHCDVISHFHDPLAEFRTMYRKLKPGGYLVFETGNIGDIDKKYYTLFHAFQYPDHLFFFTENNIKTILEQTGFTVQTIHRYSIVPQLVIQQMLKKCIPKKASHNKEKKKTENHHESGPPSAIKKVYYLLLYFLRYHLGAYFPKYKRPQTLIIIAQKEYL
jgi:2-polyprenyl-3-methyl-5-hydroxy-6-metoxy-1,4-benzoquinol methylase